jgi:RNA polymerase sigma factor (sigma-70 family)
MTEPNDHDLLAQYACTESEAAFASLVARHVSLVYSAALRFTGNAHHAQEITQAVFIILARKAGSLRRGTALSGWLYQTARLTAANFVKGEIRRQRREQEAYMRSSLTEPNSAAWEQMAPLLDEAMGQLGETDRDVIVLRFFENKTAQGVAATLKLNEAAAQKRVSRALEKLRKYFMKRGVALSATLIAGAVSANSVQAAPAGLAATVSTTAAKGATAASSVAALVEGTLSVMTWLKLKFAAGVGVAAVVVGGSLAAALWHGDAGAPLTTRDSGATQGTVAAGTVAAEEPVAEPREPLTEGALMSLDSPPGALLVQPDGKILVAASLCGSYIDPQSGKLGQFQRGAFRLNPDGSLDRSFCCCVELPGSDAHRAHLVIQPDGRVLMSGLFDSVDGKPRPGYARLLSDGRVDESFAPWQGSTNLPARTYMPGGTYPAAALSDGSVAVMSVAFEGPMAPYPLTAYRLSPSGEWMRPAKDDGRARLFSRPSGLILALGPLGFWTRKPIEWGRTTPAKRHELHFPPGTEHPAADIPFDAFDERPSAVDAAPVLAELFDEVPMKLCRYAAPLPDGGTVLAIRRKVIDGSMTGYGGLMRFDKGWRPDLSFTNAYAGDIRSCLTVKRQPDGKLLVAGIVGEMNGEAFPGLVRLHEDGQMDRSFRCETGGSWEDRVMDFVVQPDGRIVICGFFTSINGVKCQHLARLNPDGSLDAAFKGPFVSLETLNAVRFPVQPLAQAAEAETDAGAAAGGASVAPETIWINSLNYQGEVAVIQFTGNPNKAYILQGKDSLDASDWNSFSTNRASATGIGVFRDPDAKKHPTRFYRVATP